MFRNLIPFSLIDACNFCRYDVSNFQFYLIVLFGPISILPSIAVTFDSNTEANIALIEVQHLLMFGVFIFRLLFDLFPIHFVLRDSDFTANSNVKTFRWLWTLVWWAYVLHIIKYIALIFSFGTYSKYNWSASHTRIKYSWIEISVEIKRPCNISQKRMMHFVVTARQSVLCKIKALVLFFYSRLLFFLQHHTEYILTAPRRW